MDSWITPACYTATAILLAAMMSALVWMGFQLHQEWRAAQAMRHRRRTGQASEPVCFTPYLDRDDG